MTTQAHSADASTVGQDPRPGISAALLDVRAVASLLGGCSVRHVRRLTDAGKLPQPVRLGSLVRWRRAELEEWISAGCLPVRPSKSAVR